VRYLEGSIELGSKDLRLLETIAITNRITQLQLWEIANLRGIESDRKVFEWRVRRLAKAGFVKRLQRSFLGSRLLYSITKDGISALEVGGMHPLSLYVERDSDEIERQIAHSVQLNRAYIALLKAQALVRWMPAKDVAAINRAGYRPYAKTYDAVATILVDHQTFEVGFEYERTLKASERYDELLAKLQDETRAETVVYLFSNAEIGGKLEWAFRNIKTDVLVVAHDEFVRNPLDAPVMCRLLRTTVREVLRRAGAQKSVIADCRYTEALR
jgi:hypothetical protein